MNRWFLAALALIACVGLAFRVPELGLRPLHNDEGVNAMKFRALWVDNAYKYDPTEFHGPTLPYFTLPAAWLCGTRDFNQLTETTFRIVPAVFGVGLILLLLLVAPEFGKAETLWAGAMIAVSPAMVFYSRYYIHEMLLVFFTALFFFSLWRHAMDGKLRWALTAGVGLGLMAATKETFVFALAAAGLALTCAAICGRFGQTPATLAPPPPEQAPNLQSPFPSPPRSGGEGQGEGAPVSRNPNTPTISSIAMILILALIIAALFFTSFFSNAKGLTDAVRTYGPWLKRAGGQSEHVHPWNFYFQHLFWFRAEGGRRWSEGFIGVMAVIGFCVSVSGRAGVLSRLIAFYTACLTLIYTILAYKTPWCLLGFYHGMILLAGVGAASILRICKFTSCKVVASILLTVGVAQLGREAWWSNFGTTRSGVLLCSSPTNPYVYSQTSPDILRLVSTVEGLAQVSKDGYETQVAVISAQSYWPLPWYLRRFTQIGYWEAIPNAPLSPIEIVSADLHAAFDDRPEKTHLMAGYFQLRPGVFMELYVNTTLWTEYVKTLPKDAD